MGAKNLKSQHIILSFLGIDNYLRTKIFIYDEWKSISSLYLGIDTLMDIAKNKNINGSKELVIKKGRVIFHCDAQQAWLSCWPNDDFLKTIRNQSELTYSILTQKEV